MSKKQFDISWWYLNPPFSQELAELRKEAAEEFPMQLSEALSKARLHFKDEKKALREQLSDVHLKVGTL